MFSAKSTFWLSQSHLLASWVLLLIVINRQKFILVVIVLIVFITIIRVLLEVGAHREMCIYKYTSDEALEVLANPYIIQGSRCC